MPFDLDCNDSDFRAHLSEDQLARLERRQSPARRAAHPPTSLAAAVDRLSFGAGDDATTPVMFDDGSEGDLTVVNPPQRVIRRARVEQLAPSSAKPTTTTDTTATTKQPRRSRC